MHKVDWSEGDMKFSYIATKHFGENYLNPRIKYIMVRLDKLWITLVQ